jgi:hypothetical protein
MQVRRLPDESVAQQSLKRLQAAPSGAQTQPVEPHVPEEQSLLAEQGLPTGSTQVNE